MCGKCQIKWGNIPFKLLEIMNGVEWFSQNHLKLLDHSKCLNGVEWKSTKPFRTIYDQSETFGTIQNFWMVLNGIRQNHSGPFKTSQNHSEPFKISEWCWMVFPPGHVKTVVLMDYKKIQYGCLDTISTVLKLQVRYMCMGNRHSSILSPLSLYHCHRCLPVPLLSWDSHIQYHPCICKILCMREWT